MRWLRVVFALLVFVITHPAFAETNTVVKSPAMKLLAGGDHYFIHLVQGKPTPMRDVEEIVLAFPSAVVVHTSRGDGKMRQLFAEGHQSWRFVGGYNSTGSRQRTIEDVKADKSRLYLLVRTQSNSTTVESPTKVHVSLTLRVFWLEDGQLLGEHSLLSRAASKGKTPVVPRSTLRLSPNGVSCLSRSWAFDGKTLKK